MKKILLIEDNPEMRENTAEILELASYEVMTAENGKEGVRKAHDFQPDLIICDIMMPEMDGYGVLRILSKDPHTGGIPFIFLTAKAERTDMRKGMSMGADDYLTKPFEDVDLLDAVETRLRKSQLVNRQFENNEEGLTQFINEARSQEALEKLSANREVRFYQAKDFIYKENSFPLNLLFIKRGKVKTFKTNEDAKEFITGLYREGEFLGYLALLQDTAYPESAMALEDTEIVLIPKDDFFTLMYNNRTVAHKFIQMISNNLLEKEEQLLHLAYDTVRKRVADALVLLEEKYHQNEGKNFSMAISRENLANIVGTSKECVIRVLSEFKDDGIVSTNMSTIHIKDLDKLKQVKY